MGGIHNDLKTGGPTACTDRLRAITGKTPALWGGDFLFDGRMEMRWEMIFEAERQWRAGAVVNLMWHASPPNLGHSCAWEGGVLSRLSDKEWADLLAEDGFLHGVWRERMDSLLPYLVYLRDRGVAALWRPFHEMNQGKFWWGGRPGPTGSAALFRWMHDYFTREKGLKSLVWTWDVQDLRRDWAGYAPGSEFFDLMALDVYGSGFSDSWYREMLMVAGDKLVGIGEVAKMSRSQVLARQSRYCLVMGWSDLVFSENSETELIEFFNNSRILSRENMPIWQGDPDNAQFVP